MRILFVAPEGVPFSKTGGLGDVIGGLPKELAGLGHEVAVLLPHYRGTKIDAASVHQSLTVPVGPHLRFPSVVGGFLESGVRYFFLDDPEYFDRETLYGGPAGDYPDNPERFAEFSRAAIEFAKLVWRPDVIHCHDWQTALVPVFLRTLYSADPVLARIPCVLTIHNLGYQGLFDRSTLNRIGLPEELFSIDGLEFFGRVNFLKGGMIYTDWLTTVSRRYAEEIQTAEFGCGLEGVIRNKAKRLAGILNGVDYSAWSPENDRFIVARYSASDLGGKKVCKRNLLEEFQLPAGKEDRLLIGIISRFVDQKGFDLVLAAAEQMLKENLQIVALGTGMPEYEEFFRDLAAAHPDQVAVRVAYDNTLAHKIEAGSDLFLMPSRYEPCGLNQIFSLRYGTLPLVRATGGLDDTVEPFDPKTGKGTGFKFQPYEPAALLACLGEALAVYRDMKLWRKLQIEAMSRDFSWKASARRYASLYETAQKDRISEAAESSVSSIGAGCDRVAAPARS
ncbi:MAG TPA: glycogen synthase GlgA [Candidatus Dormibacteraeota bacterium]|nr:glycogen synthase GlgA [Candidatus Dormibacteraeota bacterium]